MKKKLIAMAVVVTALVSSGCATPGVKMGSSNGEKPIAGNSSTNSTNGLTTCSIPDSRKMKIDLDLGGEQDMNTHNVVAGGTQQQSKPLSAMRLVAQQSRCFIPTAYTRAMQRRNTNTTSPYTMLVEVITSAENESGRSGMAGLGSTFGPIGAIVGVVAASIQKSGATVVLTLVSNRDGEQIASASGTATGTSVGAMGLLGIAGSGAAGIGGLGGYEQTDQGKVVIGAMIDAMNNLIPLVPQLTQRAESSPLNDSRRDLVRAIQVALIRNGYSLTSDGLYGKNTKAAIADWQGKNGLIPDGEATTQLLDAMK